jgi:hypothetical protein
MCRTLDGRLSLLSDTDARFIDPDTPTACRHQMTFIGQAKRHPIPDTPAAQPRSLKRRGVKLHRPEHVFCLGFFLWRPASHRNFTIIRVGSPTIHIIHNRPRPCSALRIARIAIGSDTPVCEGNEKGDGGPILEKAVRGRPFSFQPDRSK